MRHQSNRPVSLKVIHMCVCARMCLQDHPEHGVLYLVRGLLNMVQDYTWEDNSDAKVRVYVSALPLLAAMSQETYLYSIPKGQQAHTHTHTRKVTVSIAHILPERKSLECSDV